MEHLQKLDCSYLFPHSSLQLLVHSQLLRPLFFRWNVSPVEHFGLLLASYCFAHIGESTEQPENVCQPYRWMDYDQYLNLAN